MDPQNFSPENIFVLGVEIPDDKEPDKVVDEALGSEQMSSINGEFAPYFKNITEALIFCWIQKHNICKI